MAEIADKLSYYKHVIDVQTHFNDMLLKTRTLGLTIIISLLAVAGSSIAQGKAHFVTILCIRLHIAGVFGLCGLLLSILLFLIDRQYYYKLLIAAVGVSAKFEQDNSDMFREIGADQNMLTTALSAKISRQRSSQLVILFWMIPAVICGILVVGSIRGL